MKRAILFINIFVIFVVINAAPLDKDPELDAKQRKLIGLECLNQTGADRKVIDKVLASDAKFLPKNDEKYKEFLVCSYKKQGYLNDQGTEMNYANIIKFLSRFYREDELKRNLSVCYDIKGKNSNDLVFYNLECITRILRDMEVINDE